MDRTRAMQTRSGGLVVGQFQSRNALMASIRLRNVAMPIKWRSRNGPVSSTSRSVMARLATNSLSLEEVICAARLAV